jgi:uncharacterized protein
MNWKKIYLYLLITFVISWTTAGLLRFLNIKLTNPLGIILIVTGFMSGPALGAFIVQKLIYKQQLKDIGFIFDWRKYKWYFVTIFSFVALILLTLGSVWLFGNLLDITQFGLLDFSQNGFTDRLAVLIRNTQEIRDSQVLDIASITPIGMLFAVIFGGIISGFTINGLAAFGEEFGWRGFLLSETRKMGFFWSNLFIGLIWGLWHAPIIAMGHNYPNNPILGIFWMCIFTVSVSPIHTYVRLKTGSIIAPSALHGMINSTGIVYFLLIANSNELFSTIAGLAGAIASIGVGSCIAICDYEFIKNYRSKTF